ncbi:unnamed protein product [Soboliphyme baturini]|uniref:GLOBIN domain-containing protein n=1 Tax=Soboliphyme baturini TaxID=241478 RepID=A0A183J1K5_9BILA|nr:unnamed protein product [Soboliphyme baturini]
MIRDRCLDTLCSRLELSSAETQTVAQDWKRSKYCVARLPPGIEVILIIFIFHDRFFFRIAEADASHRASNVLNPVPESEVWQKAT